MERGDEFAKVLLPDTLIFATLRVGQNDRLHVGTFLPCSRLTVLNEMKDPKSLSPLSLDLALVTPSPRPRNEHREARIGKEQQCVAHHTQARNQMIFMHNQASRY